MCENQFWHIRGTLGVLCVYETNGTSGMRRRHRGTHRLLMRPPMAWFMSDGAYWASPG